MPGGSGRLLQYSSTLTRSAFKNTHRSFKLCLGSEPLTLPPPQRTCGGEYTGLQPKLDDSLNRISEICTSTTLVVFTDIFSVSYFAMLLLFFNCIVLNLLLSCAEATHHMSNRGLIKCNCLISYHRRLPFTLPQNDKLVVNQF